MKSMARCAGRSELRVAREPVGLAECHGGDRVAVEVGDRRAADEQVAVRLLVLDEPVEPLADVGLVAALLRCGCARPPAGAGGPGRSPRCPTPGRLRGAAAALALVLEVQAPAAVGPLVPDDPVEPVLDGLLGMDRPPFAADELGLAQPLPARERGGDVLGVKPGAGGLAPLRRARAGVDHRAEHGPELGRPLGPGQLGGEPGKLGISGWLTTSIVGLGGSTDSDGGSGDLHRS